MSEKKESESFFDKTLNKFYPLGFKDEALLIFKNSIPLCLSVLSQQLLTMMSFFFCGHVGSNELAGVSLANTLIHIGSFGPILGLSSACDTLFPQLYGGRDKKKVGIIVQRGCLISLLASFFCIAFLLNSKYIMNIFVKDEAVVMLADTYLVYFSPSIFMYSLQIIISRYLQSQNIFYPILFINVFANIVNAVCQACLVIWANMGVMGAGISVVIANIVQLFVLIVYILKTQIHIPTWPGWSYECLYDWQIYLKLGIAGFGMVIFEWACFEIAVITAGLLGNIELSIMSILQQTALTFILFAFGISASGNIRVGQLLGENSPGKALNTVKVVYSITFLWAIFMATIILSFSDYIPYIFTSNKDLMKPVSTVLKFLSIVHIFDALQVCGGGILRALGAQVYGVIIAFIAYYLICLTIGLYLLLATQVKVIGFWIGVLCASIILFISQVTYICRVDWEKTAKIANESSLKKKVNENTVSEFETKTDTGEHKNLKRKIIKKIFVLASVLVVFLISLITRNFTHFSIQTPTNTTNSTKI